MVKKEIVRVHNEVVPNGMNSSELNFFYAVCSRVGNQGTNEVKISYSDLKEITQYKSKDKERFLADIESMYVKLMKSSTGLKYGHTRFALFITFDQLPTDELLVKVHPDYAWMLNDLVREFTQFELQQYVALSGVYAKGLFRYLKQWRTVGHTPMQTPESLKELLGAPNYESKFLMRDIIKPSVEELKKHKTFSNLWVETKYKKGRGKPVDGYVFHFGKEEIQGQISFDTEEEFDEIAAAATKKPKKQTKKKKNSFHNFEQREYDFDALEDALLNKTAASKTT